MTIELRVFRTFHWERDPHQEVHYGGPPPLQRLVQTDTLQMRVGDDWQDVPVAEAEKPPHPFAKPDRFAGIRRITGAQQ